jgi:hypothetical protein
MTIRSVPPGAEVAVNGIVIGKTPTAVNSDTLFPNRYFDFQLGVQTAVTLSRPGCENEILVVKELAIPEAVEVVLNCAEEPAPAPRGFQPIRFQAGSSQ